MQSDEIRCKQDVNKAVRRSLCGIAFILLAAFMTLCGCSASPKNDTAPIGEDTVTFTDALDREVPILTRYILYFP